MGLLGLGSNFCLLTCLTSAIFLSDSITRSNESDVIWSKVRRLQVLKVSVAATGGEAFFVGRVLLVY